MAPAKPAEGRGIDAHLDGVRRGNRLVCRPAELHAIVCQSHRPQQRGNQAAARGGRQRREQVRHVIVLALERCGADLSESGSIHGVDPCETPWDKPGLGLILHGAVGPPGERPGRDVYRLAFELVQRGRVQRRRPGAWQIARAQIAFYASTPSYRAVMDLHGWSATAEQLSTHAAKGEWAEMPMLIGDEMLDELCVVTDEADLAAALRSRYDGIADRLALYTPFVPGEKDEWWGRLVKEFN